MFPKCLQNESLVGIKFLFLFFFTTRTTAQSEHVMEPRGDPWTGVAVEFYFFNILPSLSMCPPTSRYIQSPLTSQSPLEGGILTMTT